MKNRTYTPLSSCAGAIGALPHTVYTAVTPQDVDAGASATFTILPEENFWATHLWISAAKDLAGAGFDNTPAGAITQIRKGRTNLLSNFAAGEGIPAELASCHPLPLGGLNVDPAVGLVVEYTNNDAAGSAVCMGLIGQVVSNGSANKDRPYVWISAASQDLAAGASANFTIAPSYDVVVSHLLISAGYDLAAAPQGGTDAIHGVCIDALTRGRQDFLSAPLATDAIPAAMARPCSGLSHYGLPLGRVALDSQTGLDFTLTNNNADPVTIQVAAACLK